MVCIGTSTSLNIKSIVGEKYLNEYSESDFIVWDNYPSTIDTGHVTYAGGHDYTVSGGQLYISQKSDSKVTYDKLTGNITITPRTMTITNTFKYYSSSSGWNNVATHSIDASIPFKVYLLVKTPNANI